MSNLISVVDIYDIKIARVVDDSITVAYNGSLPTYTVGTTVHVVAYLLAELDSDELTVVADNASASDINDIRMTASSDTEVTSRISWTAGVGSVSLVFTTPADSGQELQWEIGAAVPPIKLTVKIKRN